MIVITTSLSLNESELRFTFTHSSGPGGQNVNKVASAVKLYFDVGNSRSLNNDTRERLIALAGNRITGNGILIIDARRYRTQERNRRDAVERLAALLRRAAKKPKKRRNTAPTPLSREKRLDSKHRRAEKKKTRSAPLPQNGD